MKRLLRHSHHGQRGFTLIELLIVIAILGIIAVVVVPNVTSMLGSADVAAANTEAASVETAAIAFLADHPEHTGAVLMADVGPYLAGTVKGAYTLNDGGQITGALPGGWTGIDWDTDSHQWIKTP